MLNLKDIEAWKLKAPLVFMTAGAGLLASVSLSFVKGVTESYRADGFTEGYALYIYVVLALAIGILQLKILNKSMELYD